MMFFALAVLMGFAGMAFMFDNHSSDGDGDDPTPQDDPINGTAEDDTLNGTDGNDTINGAAGDDRLYGRAGDDTLYGGAGQDRLSGGEGNDTLRGGAGNDSLYGGGHTGNNALFGGEGDDTLSVNSRDGSTLDGGEGDDTLSFGGGDTATGGTGADTFQIIIGREIASDPAIITDYDDASGDTISIQTHGSLPNPIPVITSNEAGDAVISMYGQVVVVVTGVGGTLTLGDLTINGASTHTGTDGDDILSGHGTFYGGDGDDVITPTRNYFEIDTLNLIDLHQSDVLYGGAGNDTLYLDTHDTATGGSGNDIFSIQGLAEGINTHNIIQDYTPGEDQIIIETNLPNDVYTPRSIANYVPEITVETNAQGDALVYFGAVGGSNTTLLATVIGAGAILTADDIILENRPDIVGTGSDDTLAGTSGDDVITGLSGNDTISSGDGNDTVIGGSGNDVLNGQGDQDTLFGFRGDDTLNGGDGDDVLYGGHGSDTLNGGAGNDTIHTDLDVHNDPYTRSGTDTVNGGAGDDRITFNTYDTITGGSGNDTFIYTLPFSGASVLTGDTHSATITDYSAGDNIVISHSGGPSSYSLVASGNDAVFMHNTSNGGIVQLLVIQGAAETLSFGDITFN